MTEREREGSQNKQSELKLFRNFHTESFVSPLIRRFRSAIRLCILVVIEVGLPAGPIVWSKMVTYCSKFWISCSSERESMTRGERWLVGKSCGSIRIDKIV